MKQFVLCGVPCHLLTTKIPEVWVRVKKDIQPKVFSFFTTR